VIRDEEKKKRYRCKAMRWDAIPAVGPTTQDARIPDHDNAFERREYNVVATDGKMATGKLILLLYVV
jgi:hypothetical protein